MVILVELLKGNRLIVWDKFESQQLYKNGFFGKPLGVIKPKKDFEAPLVLDLIEGLYLLEKKIIKIYSPISKNTLSINQFKEKSTKMLKDFNIKYLIYKDLREKGFIVSPGIKYGCDFAVYKQGPGIDHAPYLIQKYEHEDDIQATQIVEAGRLATTVRKSFIIAIVNEEQIKYLEFKWWKA